MTEPPERATSVFAIADRAFTVDDVIAAAHFRGELETWWSQVLFLDGCETGARDPGEADEALIQSASEQFRYERDLITAEETESWLEARGLTEENFNDHFVRHYWAERLGGKAAPVTSDSLPASVELRELLRVEILLSGGFEKLATALSWRLAAFTESESQITPHLIDAERVHFCERTGLDASACPEWLARARQDDRWLEEMLALEAAFRLEAEAVLTASQSERMLQALRMPLTRVALEILEVESLAAAREAALCVREDGVSMEEVAAEAGYPYRREEVMVENLAPELQQKVLCAVPGEMLEPFAQGDGFHLWRLMAKIEPTLDDALVRGRVERGILERHFQELAARHVRWQPGFLPP